MTESEWLLCEEPRMLLKRTRFRSSKRKSRLFAVACCRCVWPLLVDERSRQAIEVAERHADGKASDAELASAANVAHKAHQDLFDAVGKVGACLEWAAAYAANANPFHSAKNASWMAATPRAFQITGDVWNEPIRLLPCRVTQRNGPPALVSGKWQVDVLAEALPTGAEKPLQAALIRCIFGNPFRPVILDPDRLVWNDGTLPRLAQAIYTEAPRVFPKEPVRVEESSLGTA